MLIPRKTVIAGIVFGLFVSGASLAQAAEFAELNKDTEVTPKGDHGVLDTPPYQDQNVEGHGFNLTFTTSKEGPYWDRIFAASNQNMEVRDIGALQIIDSNAADSDGLIYASGKHSLTINAARSTLHLWIISQSMDLEAQ